VVVSRYIIRAVVIDPSSSVCTRGPGQRKHAARGRVRLGCLRRLRSDLSRKSVLAFIATGSRAWTIRTTWCAGDANSCRMAVMPNGSSQRLTAPQAVVGPHTKRRSQRYCAVASIRPPPSTGARMRRRRRPAVSIVACSC
jgi:hypothetical protein